MKTSILCRNSILAGMMIGLGASVNLIIGGPLGALLFSFGLIMIILYRFTLFTGVVGLINKKYSIGNIAIVLLGNIIGCFFIAPIVMVASGEAIDESLYRVISDRLNSNLIYLFCGSILTGLIVEGAVEFGSRSRVKTFLPTLFGIPIFILCGWPHCIADCFYMISYLFKPNCNINYIIIPTFIMIVIGNSIGCNIVRFLIKNEKK